MDWHSIALLISIAVLLVLSALSSAAETALTSVNRIRMLQLADEENRNAKIVLDILEHTSRFLSTILLINNLVNILAASLATVLAQRVFQSSAVAIATGAMTFLVLVFGEITPKSYSAQNAERVSLRIAKPVAFLVRLLYPIVRILVPIANLFIRLMGGKMVRAPFFTEEEIKTIVSVGEEAGVIEEEEKEMIHSIFEFGDTVVREVMIPRVDMVVVESSASLEEVMDVIVKVGHSRIPVFEKSIDNIIGIIYAKDLLIQLNKMKGGKPKGNSLLKKLLRPAYYIPESKRVSELLKELQNKKIHMAIVLDEYGGTAGLVTIEDLLEEIVGEIFDEYDLEEALVEPLGENGYRLDARANLDEVGELLAVDFPEDVGDTIGGLVYNLVGHIPATGDTVSFRNLEFKVEKVVGRRLLKIVVTRREPEEEAEEE